MAAVDYFLKIDGIQGESKADKHKDEIDVQSFSWGATQSGTFAPAAAGGPAKLQCRISISPCGMNKASPALMLACAQGDHIKNAILTCRKAGKEQQEFLKVTMSDVLGLILSNRRIRQAAMSFRQTRSHSTSRKLNMNTKSRMPPESWGLGQEVV